MIEDAKPGDVEAVVQEELDAANTKVVIEELVSYIRGVHRIYSSATFYLPMTKQFFDFFECLLKIDLELLKKSIDHT